MTSFTGFPRYLLFAVPFLSLVASMHASAGMDSEPAPAVKFERTRAALDGDPSAIAWIESRSADNDFDAYLLGAVQQHNGNPDAASDAFERAVEHGHPYAPVALALLHTEAGKHGHGLAWSQAALLAEYTPEEIEDGKANHTFLLWLFLENLEHIDTADNEEVDALADRIIEQWTPRIRENLEAAREGYANAKHEDDGWSPGERNPPRYPATLANRRIPGWTLNYILFNRDGDCEDVITLTASHTAFGKRARKAIEQWTFEPPENAQEGLLSTQVIEFSPGE